MKRLPFPTTKCESCVNGMIPGPDAGAALRREREERDVTRTALLAHFNYSESYTIDLERGARPLTWLLVTQYREAIEAAVKARLEVQV